MLSRSEPKENFQSKAKVKPLVEIYTDGACSGNPGPGGWGAYMIYKNIEKKISGFEKSTTNNRMEIQAVIEALRKLKSPCKINLYTDSKYVMQGITEWINNWQKNNWLNSSKKPVKNSDLWQLLLQETSKHDILWHWVKGHADNEGNNIADELATSAIKEQLGK